MSIEMTKYISIEGRPYYVSIPLDGSGDIIFWNEPEEFVEFVLNQLGDPLLEEIEVEEELLLEALKKRQKERAEGAKR